MRGYENRGLCNHIWPSLLRLFIGPGSTAYLDVFVTQLETLPRALHFTILAHHLRRQ